MMERLAVPFRRLQPGRYAAGLRAALYTHEPRRRLDLLLAGAIIEARSCERFRLLAGRLHSPLAEFYADLERAEARHAGLYLELASAAAAADWHGRLAELLQVETGLIQSDDIAAALSLRPAGRSSCRARQRHQFIAGAIATQVAALFVPGAEHVAVRGRPLQRELMHSGAMRVAVDQRAHACRA